MRDFLKVAAASAVGTVAGLLSLVVLMGLGAFSLVGVFLASGGQEPEVLVEKDSLLVMDLSTDIVDGVPADAGALFEVYGGPRSISLYKALDAIAAAAEDDKISGIYLEGSSFEGLATLKEVRDALSKFKESGKPIWAYSTSFNERDYYLTSVADNLMLAPVGTMEINGFRAETQFLSDALDKYGVGVQVVRVGKYKSAVEPFIRSESSTEDKQQTQALLSDRWQDFLNTVSSDRDITPQQLQALADNVALIEPDEALEAGLVDRLGFYDDVRTELKALTGAEDDENDEDSDDDDLPEIQFADYAQMVAKDKLASTQFTDEETIAVIYAEGEIIVGEDIQPGAITSQGLADTLRDARQDEDIQAVVLRVNSPGGSAIASEIITDEVKKLAEEKPLIVSMGDYAASGGYMIAAPGAKILASPNTITGSIGVYGLLLNFQEIANNNGITWDTIKTAKFADMQTASRPQTDAELKIQQDYVDTLYERFTSIVAEGRDISKDRVSQVSQGRVWTGKKAIDADLVDELGGLQDAIALAAETAEIEDFKVAEFPRLPSLEEQLLDSIFGVGITAELAQLVTQLPWNKDPLTDELLKIRENLTLLENLNDPNNMYMRLPFTTDID